MTFILKLFVALPTPHAISFEINGFQLFYQIWSHCFTLFNIFSTIEMRVKSYVLFVIIYLETYS